MLAASDECLELELVNKLAQKVAAGQVSKRLTKHFTTFGNGDLQKLIENTYWELGFGVLYDADRVKPVMTIGTNPSEDNLFPEKSQPWGILPISERINRWRGSDAWSLGGTNRAEFERLNNGLDYGKPHTWAYFQRLLKLFEATGQGELLKGCYSTNISKFTSPDTKAIAADIKDEIKACQETLLRQIQLVAPGLIVIIGTQDGVPTMLELFNAHGSVASFTEIKLQSNKRSCRYFRWDGNLPGVEHTIRVVAIPHTSGQAHLNFDPFFDGLVEEISKDVVHVYCGN